MRGLLFAITLCAGTAAQGQEFTTLKGHGGPIMGIAVSPGGQVATASFDNSVGLWTDRHPTWAEGHEAAVTAIAYGANGLLVTGSDDFSVRIWDGVQSRILGRHKGKVAGLAVSPAGDSVISGSWDGSIMMWPLDGADPTTLPSPGANVTAVGLSPDGARLYAATTKGELLLYDMADLAPPRALVHHGFGINRLVVAADWIAYGAVDGGTRVIEPLDGAQISDFTLDRRPILSMAHHAETGQLAVGDGHGYIMMVDTSAWRITRDFRATRQGPVWALAFSNDGAVIHAGGLDDVAYAWPVEMLGEFEPGISGERSFLQDPETMPNGERQFMRKCSICHALSPGTSRKAGPTLAGLFGRRAGTVPGYRYSPVLTNSDIIWDEGTVDALFDLGPDHYIPGSKMPMQVIAGPDDRADLIAFLKDATKEE